MTDILNKICTDKLELIKARKAVASENTLLAHAKSALPTRGFLRAIQAKTDLKQIALIAEIKKASPSKGVIRADFDPVAIAQAYESAGASCLSVLTDTPYFQGEDYYLTEARAAVSLPVLRKDFMLDPYQVVEARALGADCILLIMAALEDAQASELEEAARSLGMDVLVEVHNQEELERALMLKTPLLGINNRNLKTLEISLSVTEKLSLLVPETHILVCESGIHSHADILSMHQHNAYAFLVGESLMKQQDIGTATRLLLQGK